jgi:hypothetical protein
MTGKHGTDEHPIPNAAARITSVIHATYRSVELFWLWDIISKAFIIGLLIMLFFED